MLIADRFAEVALSRVQAHELPNGHFRRFAQGSPTSDPYGCADAVNLLYTLSALPEPDGPDAKALIDALVSHQGADGMFEEATHHGYHTTAHCIAALDLLDAKPTHRPSAMDELTNVDALVHFLDSLDWSGDPWRASHLGSGIYAALVLTKAVDSAWQDAYFEWLEAEWDPTTGLLRRRAIHRDDYDRTSPDKGEPCLFHDLAGSFHYVFNFVHAGRPIPHAEALVDTCLRIDGAGLYPLCTRVGFAEIDWIYCLHRAVAQSDHRPVDAENALRKMASRYLGFLEPRLDRPEEHFGDLHTLFGAVCALAELKLALPEAFPSHRPILQVLDRRPFI